MIGSFYGWKKYTIMMDACGFNEACNLPASSSLRSGRWMGTDVIRIMNDEFLNGLPGANFLR